MSKKKLLIVGLSSFAILIFVMFILFSNGTKTYKVSFETGGGSYVETQKVLKNGKVKKPKDPTKKGYLFVEWTYNGKTYDFSLDVNSDIVLKAKWEKVKDDVETYTVKFNSDGGTTISNQIVKKGDKIKEPDEPKKEGYVFIGWQVNNENWDFNKPVDKNMELKAKWEKIVKEDESTSGDDSSKKNNVNNSSNKTTSKTSNNYKNNNASSNKTTNTIGSNNNNNNNEAQSTPTNNVEPVLNKYTVTFDTGGAASISSQTVTEGSKASKPENPTKDGYVFDGWLLNGNTYDFNSTVNSNITLHAKWTKKSYTVKVSNIDQYSPDRKLTVFEDGKEINVSQIKYNDTVLCNGSNMVVNMYDISGISSVTVILTNGTSVSANLQ